MKKPDFLKRFTLVDYLIILIVIAVIIVGFAHILSTDDNDESETSSYDASTISKVVENYLGLYLQGKVVETTINGFNATNGEEVVLRGTVEWADDDRGSNVKVLVDGDDGNRYLAGMYEDTPYADVYIDTISLESDGKTYENLTEITADSRNITNLNNIIEGIPENANYEVSTTVTVDSLDSLAFQEIVNHFYHANERISLKGSNTGLNDQITIIRATSDEISYAGSSLGEIRGITTDITIRIYNCTSQDLESIESSFDVLNIRTF